MNAAKERAPVAANDKGPGQESNASVIVAAREPARNLQAVAAEKIPQALRDAQRWCVWRAEWNPRGRGGQGKWDKIPAHPRGHGLSTGRPADWVSLAAALEALAGSPDRWAGVGYLMTGAHGLVGIDLDHCVEGNTIAPWALEILDRASSYAELSPSGEGLRVFVLGAVAGDWTNHERGVEVYGGHAPRFLTVTGQRLRRGPETVNEAPAGFLEWLAAEYQRTPADGAGEAPGAGMMPDLVDELAMPDLATLELAPATRELLEDGTTGADRSRALHSAAVDLCRAGLDDDQVLSMLAANEHTMGIALDHRRQDHDRALDYLWREHVVKARPKAASRVASIDDFEDVSSDTADETGKLHPWAQFIDIESRPRAPRFIIPGFIQEGVVVLSGEPGIGKTTALVPLAMIAAGLHRAGEPLAPEHWRHVCYITEDEDQVHRVLHALVEFAGWVVDARTVAERLHVAPARRLAPGAAVKVGHVFRAAFTRTVAGVEIPPLVVIDTKAAALALENENDNAEVSAAIAAFKQQFSGLPTWLIGHTAKTSWGQPDASKLSSRGGGAWGADAHQQLFLVDEDGRRLLRRGKTRFEARWSSLEIKGFVNQIETLDDFGQPRSAAVRWGAPIPVDADIDGMNATGDVGGERSLQALCAAISVLEGKGESLPAVERGSSTSNSVLKAHGFFVSRNAAKVSAMLREAARSGLIASVPTCTAGRKVREFWRLTDTGRAQAMGAPNEFPPTP